MPDNTSATLRRHAEMEPRVCELIAERLYEMRPRETMIAEGHRSPWQGAEGPALLPCGARVLSASDHRLRTLCGMPADLTVIFKRADTTDQPLVVRAMGRAMLFPTILRLSVAQSESARRPAIQQGSI
jgi:hypothetical protein